MTLLAAGEVLSGTYRIERLVRRGSHSELYVVAHTRLPRRFALKRLHVEPAQRSSFSQRAACLGRLRHPHIVEVLDWNHTPSGEPYLVMELLAGEDLATFLRRKRTISTKLALALLAQIGAALSTAHQAGVVHGGLKPSQVFLLRRGPLPHFIKVLDFGLSPSSEAVDPLQDQHALATLLHEMLSRSPTEQVSDRVAAALSRALQSRPQDRFSTVDGFLDALAIRTPRAPQIDAARTVTSPLRAATRRAITAVYERRFSTLLVVAVLALGSVAWALFLFL